MYLKPPQQLVRKWSEPLKVQSYGDACITATSFMPAAGNTSENCLYVNIFVPGEIFVHIMSQLKL